MSKPLKVWCKDCQEYHDVEAEYLSGTSVPGDIVDAFLGMIFPSKPEPPREYVERYSHRASDVFLMENALRKWIESARGMGMSDERMAAKLRYVNATQREEAVLTGRIDDGSVEFWSSVHENLIHDLLESGSR